MIPDNINLNIVDTIPTYHCRHRLYCNYCIIVLFIIMLKINYFSVPSLMLLINVNILLINILKLFIIIFGQR